MTEARAQSIRVGFYMLAAAVFLVALGIQAKMAQDSSDRFRDQQMCLNQFASELVSTLNTRVAANARLDAAEKAKIAASDRVVEIAAFASRTPPEADREQFLRALERFVRTKARLAVVEVEVRAELAKNPYPETETPEAACSR